MPYFYLNAFIDSRLFISPFFSRRLDESAHQPQVAAAMTFVVTDNCILCKHTDCVEVCPVDCFYEGPNFLVIDPDECIDCALCEPECPANAIFSEDEVPKGQEIYIKLNEELAQTWPNITEMKDSMPDAEKWDGVADKLQYLEK